MKRMLIICAVVLLGIAQIPKLPDLPGEVLDKLPSTDKILKSEAPVTTNIKDAVTDIPFLDDFNPEDFIPMTALPRSQSGAFRLDRPGLYALTVESFCLRAGEYGPSEGDGYAYAPLKGPQADIVQHVLQGAYAHPEIPQRDVQVLIWAIIARTKISDMSQEMQMTAARLLTAQEIFELNGGALGLVPESERAKAFDKVPDQVRSVLEAEAQLREMLTQGQENYEELEAVAVRTGVAPLGKDSRNVPYGRWSFYREGFFVRYLPRGYKTTRIELYVPEPFDIERDEQDRIILLADRNGNRIEITYDDAIHSASMRGDSKVKGYYFKSVRFVHRKIVLPEVAFDLEQTWKSSGWTLVGELAPSKTTAVILRGAGDEDRYLDFNGRHEWAMKHKRELEVLDKHLKPKDGMRDLMDLGHLTLAFEKMISEDRGMQPEWVLEHVDLVRKAWQYAFGKRVGGYVWSQVREHGPHDGAPGHWLGGLLRSVISAFEKVAFASPSADKIPWFDPSGGAATPGNTSNQRLGQSGRQKGSKEDCDALNNELKQEKDLLEAFQDKGLQQQAQDENWSADDYYDAVKEKALNGRGKSADDWEAPMELGDNCEIQYNWGGNAAAALQEYIRQFGPVAGPILFNAHQTHEQTHADQCTTFGPDRFNNMGSTPEGLSDFEEEAYKKGIAEKEKGLKGMGCE
jgi:hypothetical protein